MQYDHEHSFETVLYSGKIEDKSTSIFFPCGRRNDGFNIVSGSKCRSVDSSDQGIIYGNFAVRVKVNGEKSLL